MLPSEIPRLATDLLVRVFPGVWKRLFFKTPFLGWISSPTSFVSLFIFYILSYLLLKSMGCLSGCLMSSASILKLFCGICSVYKYSNDFVGEKVVSLLYSSSILGPPLIIFYCAYCVPLFHFAVFLCSLIILFSDWVSFFSLYLPGIYCRFFSSFGVISRIV